jgi:uncharacterized membrane protein (DUF4010 family)
LFTRLADWLPPEGVKIILVLFLSFLVGLEREEHHAEQRATERYAFGGVRTFPLIGLVGYAMQLISGAQFVPVTIGFAVIAGFLWLSYQHKLQTNEYAGVTTEFSGLAVYLVGALVSRGEFWIATTLAILCVLLLELKEGLENLSARLPGTDILALTKFLLLTAVILPIVPHRSFGPFEWNPYKVWLIVVAASGISFGSYLLQKVKRGRGSLFVSSVLGGAYSSTFTTIVLAKRARDAKAPHVYAGSMLMSSGTMYIRILVLIAIFNRALMIRILLPFLVLGAVGLLGGWLWSHRVESRRSTEEQSFQVKNPLELWSAFLFALIFTVLLVVTYYAVEHFGRGGVYGVGALAGALDVDPFVLSMTQSGEALALAAGGIIVATASNNVMKGIYAFGFGDRATGRQALALLVLLAALGLVPLAFIGRM